MRSATALLVAALVAGCAGGGERSTEIRFEPAPASIFGPEATVRSNRVFDLLAIDLDIDGDEDLLINWHHLAPLELFTNSGDGFRLVNPSADDRSGLWDNPGVPALFAPYDTTRRRIERLDSRGLHVWHDLDRRGRWRFLWRPGPEGAARLEVETSLPIERLDGLAPNRIAERRPRWLAVELPAEQTQAFALATRQVTTGIVLTLHAANGLSLPVRVGRHLTLRPAGEIELWKPDPHGIAWGDVEGDRRPEIYITRGALIGRLVPPRRAKRDRYYVGSVTPLYEMTSGAVVPRDRSRGRRVEWVDGDGDGRPDLSVASEASPNRLLTRRIGSRRFTDRAPDLGLDLSGGAVQSWSDYDGDGRDDLYVLGDGAVDILRNRDGASFETIPGASVGLVLPTSFEPAETQFDFASIRLVDFDADGDLDLWLLAAGRRRTNHLFRRRGAGFADATSEVGLAELSGNIFAILCDFDNDGYEDGLSSGRLASDPEPDTEAGHAILWHNESGRRLRLEPLPRSVVAEPIHAATCLDADRDGLTDVAAAGPRRVLLRNRTPQAGSWVRITPTDRGRGAVGAVVRLAYSDGRIVARRFGSARSSAFSQSLAPLHFGLPEGTRIEKLTVRWPGERLETVHPAPRPADTGLVERRGDPAQPPR